MLIRTGDILMYYRPTKPHRLVERAIQLGEILEDGIQDREYYHVAIAVDAQTKVEANGVYVAKADIEKNRSFDLFRPPIAHHVRHQAMQTILTMEGQKYDWWLIFDDVLRYISFGLLRLPESFIAEREQTEKICSTLVGRYLRLAGYKHVDKRFPSPEDIYLAVKRYKVSEVSHGLNRK